MPAKTGGSHAIASFVTLVVGTTLSKYLWEVAPPLGEASLVVIKAIRSTAGIELPAEEDFAGTLVIMVGLSFVWGIMYHFNRHS